MGAAEAETVSGMAISKTSRSTSLKALGASKLLPPEVNAMEAQIAKGKGAGRKKGK